MDPLAGSRLKDISFQDIKRLVDDAVPEGLHVDYKQELHLDNRDEKKEFLRDVTAFANGEGGLLVYGIEEERDQDGKPAGIPRSVVGIPLMNADSSILAIEHLLKDGIDERLPTYEIHLVAVSAGIYVILLRIPASLRSPHMVMLGGERRFYVRMNGGKQDMSTAQVRDAVLKTQSIEEQALAFVNKRLNKLSAAAGGNAFWALHLLPLVRSARAIDVTREDTIQTLAQLHSALGGIPQHCLDGYKFFHNYGDNIVSYSLIQRDGSIEFMDQFSVSRQEPVCWFSSQSVHEIIASCLACGLRIYKAGLLVPPAIVNLTFIGLGGYRLPSIHTRSPAVAPPDPIVADPIVLTEIDTDPNLILKPFMDVVWNAFGQRRCRAYDPDGNYVGYQ